VFHKRLGISLLVECIIKLLRRTCSMEFVLEMKCADREMDGNNISIVFSFCKKQIERVLF
jgi:hypothetical protein